MVVGVTYADLVQHTINWMNRNGYQVPAGAAQLHAAPGQVDPNWGGYAQNGSVNFVGPTAGALTNLAGRMGKRGYVKPGQVQAAATMLHELAHLPFHARGGSEDPTIRDGEEGATESVAQDLLAPYMRQMFGYNVGPLNARGSAYAPQVQQVRQASTILSGAPNWRDRRARVWRRTYWNATPEQRAQMMAKAANR